MIHIRLRNLQPLCLAVAQAQGTIRRTLNYIPGSVLRGALAARLRAARPAISQSEFDRLILAPGAQFQNLSPLPTSSEVAWPLPLTARTCKLFDGFVPARPEPGQRASHGVRDVLLASLRYVLADQQDKSACLPDVYCRFQGNCDLPLEAYEDHFYSGDQAGYYEAIRPKRRQITQTAIDPRRETASPANLFTVEAMEEGQTFAGYFTLGDSAAEKEFSETVCCQGSHLRLGYGRTRGLGLTEVEICKVEEPVPWRQTLPERLQAFNELAHQERCRVSVGQTLFALTLLADAVVLDPFFRPLTSLDGATLGREIHPALADAQLILAFADTRLVAGWSSPQGLPVAPDQAIAAGSVFVFTTTLSQTDLAALFTTTEVERRGIGERTIEGCGQVAVCHPFHQEVMPS